MYLVILNGTLSLALFLLQSSAIACKKSPTSFQDQSARWSCTCAYAFSY
uniref:Uncharacterized protein n=1 Tax=Arundo donax TaxID=35708 RepID=A0A0A9CM00_ARUDO